MKLIVLIVLVGVVSEFHLAQTASSLLEFKQALKFRLEEKWNSLLSKQDVDLTQTQIDLIGKRNAKCSDETDVRFTESKHLNQIEQMFDSTLFDSYLNQTLIDFEKQCLSISQIDKFYEGKETEFMHKLLLSQLFNTGCDLCDSSKNSSKPAITKLETWGYGVLFVTLISMSSLCGAFVIPFSKKNIYKKILMFLIAIAVGSLAGSGFLHLIPQAFGITEDPTYSAKHAYVWKSVVMMGGVYLFFIVETVLKLMILRRKTLKNSTTTPRDKSNNNANTIENPEVLESIGYLKTYEQTVDPNVEMRTRLNDDVLSQDRHSRKNHGHSHGIEDLQTVAPVAWMIIFGDGLHNFIDGLSIGAAFTESVLKGISICLAVICEEFPHELGDFAILINAGMSYPVALLFNFLSACCCFVGLAVGITLGENLKANEWIYAIAGGMFLYISLCDMIPELNEMGEEIERDYVAEYLAKKKTARIKMNKTENEEIEESRSLTDQTNGVGLTVDSLTEPGDVGFLIRTKLKILIIQNIGIITGFGFMLVMALFADSIQME